ncbi:MAG: nucleotide sugar dehydrogenase, partial [Actinobacteria bacterium]|nr:nucleotide sugar dehydrogenase [Actinomycetota bacterium]
MRFSRDVVVIGGCGHVGLPLGLALADRGLNVALYDLNQDAVDLVTDGQLPFNEPGAPEVLVRVLGRNLIATTDPAVVATAECLVVVVGTPIDETLCPDPRAVSQAIEELADHLVDGQLLVLRSTIFPGVTALVERVIAQIGRDVDVAFCPERIAEGRAMAELFDLPQIVSGRTNDAVDRAEKLFRNLTGEVVRLL